jgi:hypothetical protein
MSRHRQSRFVLRHGRSVTFAHVDAWPVVVSCTMELMDRHVALCVPSRRGRVRQSPPARFERGRALPRGSGEAGSCRKRVVGLSPWLGSYLAGWIDPWPIGLGPASSNCTNYASNLPKVLALTGVGGYPLLLPPSVVIFEFLIKLYVEQLLIPICFGVQIVRIMLLM